MPSKVEFVPPTLHPYDKDADLVYWSQNLVQSILRAFYDIAESKVSSVLTARAISITVAAAFIIDEDGFFIFVQTDGLGAVTSDTTTAIADGKEVGEQKWIINLGTDAVTIKNNANTKFNADFVAGQYDGIWVVWDGSNWIRLNSVNN